MPTEREIEAGAKELYARDSWIETKMPWEALAETWREHYRSCSRAALEAAERERDKTKPIPFLPFEEQWD